MAENSKEKEGIRKRIFDFIGRAWEDQVVVYAAQISFFMILSFLPFVLFLTMMVSYTSLSYNDVRDIIVAVIPQNLQSFVLQIVVEVYRRNTVVLPIYGLLSLWSSGKAVASISNGLNSIYHVKETRNWLINRLYAMVYMFVFTLAMIGTLLLLVLGNRIVALTMEVSRFWGGVLQGMVDRKEIFVFIPLFLVFLVMFRNLPNRKASYRSQVPGALFSTIGWIIFSYLFSFYMNVMSNLDNLYGNISSLILIMLWLYNCLMIMMYCAEVNSFFDPELRRLDRFLKKSLISLKKKTQERIRNVIEKETGERAGEKKDARKEEDAPPSDQEEKENPAQEGGGEGADGDGKVSGRPSVVEMPRSHQEEPGAEKTSAPRREVAG